MSFFILNVYISTSFKYPMKTIGKVLKYSIVKGSDVLKPFCWSVPSTQLKCTTILDIILNHCALRSRSGALARCRDMQPNTAREPQYFDCT